MTSTRNFGAAARALKGKLGGDKDPHRVEKRFEELLSNGSHFEALQRDFAWFKKMFRQKQVRISESSIERDMAMILSDDIEAQDSIRKKWAKGFWVKRLQGQSVSKKQK